LLSVDGDGVDVVVGMRVAMMVAVDPSLCVFAACCFRGDDGMVVGNDDDGDRSTNKEAELVAPIELPLTSSL
jgi:hypothetical protein